MTTCTLYKAFVPQRQQTSSVFLSEDFNILALLASTFIHRLLNNFVNVNPNLANSLTHKISQNSLQLPHIGNFCIDAQK